MELKINKSVTSLNIGVFWDPPWIRQLWRNGSKPGIFMEYLKLICISLLADCRFVEAETTEYGYFENGSWHGILKDIIDGKYNTTFPSFSPTPERSELFDFSDLVFHLPFVLFTRIAGPLEFSIWNFLVFHWSVWICFLFLSIFIGTFYAFSESRHKHKLKKVLAKSFNNCLDAFPLMSSVNESPEVVFLSANFLILFWSLMTVIITGVYASRLLSDMTRPQSNRPFTDFNTFVTCVEEKNCRLATNALSNSNIQEIYNSSLDVLNRLKAALVDNPIIEDSEYNILQLMLKTKHQYVTWYTSYAYFAEMTEQNRNCLYTMVLTEWVDLMAFPFLKNSTLLKKLNSKISTLNEMGVLQRIFNEYVGTEQNCQEKSIEGSKPMKFTSMAGLLLIIAIGGILAFLSFIVEIVYYQLIKIYKNHIW